MHGVAKGTFEITMAQIGMENVPAEAGLARMSIAKKYAGDLDGSGVGQMMACGSPASGSGVYVAIERVTAAVGGKSGSFALHHRGIMEDGKPTLEIRVVPGSGTGALVGVTGELRIEVVEKQHYYEFEYSLP